MAGPYVKKEKLKVKQETTDTATKVKVGGKTNDDVIVICDTDEIVVIDADIDVSDLPAGADDTNGSIPAWEWCGGCETYPESGNCAECGRVYHRCDPCADVVFTADDLVIKHLMLPSGVYLY